MEARKRKSSSKENILQEFKRQKTAISATNLLDLSDCTLLHILQYLDTTDLYTLGRTCDRLRLLVTHKILWVHVDARRKPNNRKKTKFCVENIGKHTKRLYFAARERSFVLLPRDYIKNYASTRLNNLTVLALEHQYIDGKNCPMNRFPRNLRELSLKYSFVDGSRNFFRHSSKEMSNLQVLVLDSCRWLTFESVFSLSKYPKLEVLSLYMCQGLNESMIGYISIAGRHGFPALKVIDLRFTFLGNQFVSTFSKNRSLQELYFEAYGNSYRVERSDRLRKLEGQGYEPDQHSYYSESEVDETDETEMSEKFGEIEHYHFDHITDEMLRSMAHELTSTGRTEPPIRTHFYVYPYGECTCGFVPGDVSSVHSNGAPRTGTKSVYYCVRQPETQPFASNMYDSCATFSRLCTRANRSHEFRSRRDPRSKHEIELLEHSDQTDIDSRPRPVHRHGLRYESDSPSEHNRTVLITVERNGHSTIERKPRHVDTAPKVTEQEMIDFVGAVRSAARGDAIDRIVEVLEKMLGGKKLKNTSGFKVFVRKCFIDLTKSSSGDIDSVLHRHELCFKDLLSELKRTRKVKSTTMRFFSNLNRYERRFWTYVPSLQDGDEDKSQSEEVKPDGTMCCRGTVAEKTALRKLSLRNYPDVGDPTLSYLSAIELDLLDVSNTRCTEQGIREYVRTHPECRVVHECACTCTPLLHF